MQTSPNLVPLFWFCILLSCFVVGVIVIVMGFFFMAGVYCTLLYGYDFVGICPGTSPVDYDLPIRLFRRCVT